jgi:hypothetical protein
MREEHSDSHICGVSLRGVLALVLVLSVCSLSIAGVNVTEPLHSMATLALGFYFGQKYPGSVQAIK